MDDYISREAVINITAETGAWETQNRVKELPSADVQPVKHGEWVEKRIIHMKWIPNDDDSVNPDDVEPERMTEQKCSYCNRWTIKFTDHIELNYCPLCGCKQDLDGDSE